MSHGYYIWYRVNGDGRDAETAIRSMMARLACRTGIAGRLMKKHGEPGLWMEIYEGFGDIELFSQHLAQAVDEYDIEMFIEGSRHTECFVDSASTKAHCHSLNQ